MRRLLLVLTLVVGLTTAPSSLAATGVSITNNGFRPIGVTVVAGETVTWTNNDTSRHQVVANDGSFSSPVLAAGQSFSHVFRSGGTFAYHDGVRPRLTGNVGVVPPQTVWVRRAGFQPTPISIQAGEQVTWTNRHTANHQIVADDGSFTSPVLARGRSFSRRFESAGT
jgi:plastocyanin